MTSATKNKGVEELRDKMLSEISRDREDNILNQESYFLNKWIHEAYGEFGLGVLEHFKNERQLDEGTFEQKELAYKSLMANFLTRIG